MNEGFVALILLLTVAFIYVGLNILDDIRTELRRIKDVLWLIAKGKK